MQTDKKANRLINEKSPYLLQHAYNPVDWHPWSDEAFALAQNENKPVFLSIGYSTCHWCHVMEKESFEDAEVAALMNNFFVNIKLDREERPDIDGIYMSVCQAMTGGGGWPLTIIMTPDKKPFFAGTYFPKETKYNRIGMMDLLRRINHMWVNANPEVRNSAEELASAFGKHEGAPQPVFFDADILHSGFNILRQKFDKDHGGFGGAPKFPTPHNLMFLLRYHHYFDEPEALEMTEKTMAEILRGGIYDHIGGGIHRYSTDKKWLLPHFEKMLYDQAGMALVLAELYQVTGDESYSSAAQEILSYVQRDLTSPNGAFYSAEDADSEGEEGKFYIWTKEEITKLLGDDTDLFCRIFHFHDEGNFFDPFKGGVTGENIVHFHGDLTTLTGETGIPAAIIQDKISDWFTILYEHRSKRIRPHLDDKILTDWNGLMIAAFAKAGFAFDDAHLLEAAKTAAAFINKHLLTEDGRLIHRYRDNEARFEGLIDDYAFYIYGLLELYTATQQPEHLRLAIALCKHTVEHFHDNEHGGFFVTADYAEKLLTRPKEVYDGAIPSGNSVMLLNLLRLFSFTGDKSYMEPAQKTIDYFAHSIQQFPAGYTFFLSASTGFLKGYKELVIAEGADQSFTAELLDEVRNAFYPDLTLHCKKHSESSLDLIAPFTKEMTSQDKTGLAYVCKDFTCGLPSNNIKEVVIMLEG